MIEEEITSMVQKLFTGIKAIAEGGSVESAEEYAGDLKKSIREKSVLCCISVKSFKILTKKLLAIHDLHLRSIEKKYDSKRRRRLSAIHFNVNVERK